ERDRRILQRVVDGLDLLLVEADLLAVARDLAGRVAGECGFRDDGVRQRVRGTARLVWAAGEDSDRDEGILSLLREVAGDGRGRDTAADRVLDLACMDGALDRRIRMHDRLDGARVRLRGLDRNVAARRVRLAEVDRRLRLPLL